MVANDSIIKFIECKVIVIYNFFLYDDYFISRSDTSLGTV
jgi:hypothetical protein